MTDQEWEEQFDEQILLYYDGRKETNLLTDIAERAGDKKQEFTTESNIQDNSEIYSKVFGEQLQVK